MSTFDEFKLFIKNKPFLKDKVKNGETTWQELYERYDLYGPSDEIFAEEKKQDDTEEKEEVKEETKNEGKSDDSMGSFFNMLSGIDVDKISDGLNGMKKILNILSEVTAGDEISGFSTRRNQKPYKRDDD